MSVRDYLLLVAVVCVLMGAGMAALGMRRLSAARSLPQRGDQDSSAAASQAAGCAAGVIVLAGAWFLLGGLVLLAAGLIVA